MNIDQLFSGFNMSAMGMTYQRRKMNAIADNLANVETTRTSDGGVYKRKIVVPHFQSEADGGFLGFLRNSQLKLANSDVNHFPHQKIPGSLNDGLSEELLTTVIRDESEPLLEYNPSHPDADENGMVQKPNVNIVTEMVDMIAASRAFEANVVAINASKNMMKDSLQI
jgi:flagellar basal-body rod protein FlgC